MERALRTTNRRVMHFSAESATAVGARRARVRQKHHDDGLHCVAGGEQRDAPAPWIPRLLQRVCVIWMILTPVC